MTALLTSAPLASAAYAVDGPSAVVPGTSLRLPVLPDVQHLPASERCHGCAGTGVDFVAGTLGSCSCMEPTLPAPAAPVVVEHLGSVSRTLHAAPGMQFVPGEGYRVTEVLV